MTDGVEVSSVATVFAESGPLAVKAACAQAATDTTNNKERQWGHLAFQASGLFTFGGLA